MKEPTFSVLPEPSLLLVPESISAVFAGAATHAKPHTTSRTSDVFRTTQRPSAFINGAVPSSSGPTRRRLTTRKPASILRDRFRQLSTSDQVIPSIGTTYPVRSLSRSVTLNCDHRAACRQCRCDRTCTRNIVIISSVFPPCLSVCLRQPRWVIDNINNYCNNTRSPLRD